MEKIKITIDGKEIFAENCKTVLEIAAENKIEIPNLCYNKNLKIYGACGLCVVEAEGNSKLLRACATVAKEAEQLLKIQLLHLIKTAKKLNV